MPSTRVDSIKRLDKLNALWVQIARSIPECENPDFPHQVIEWLRQLIDIQIEMELDLADMAGRERDREGAD